MLHLEEHEEHEEERGKESLRTFDSLCNPGKTKLNSYANFLCAFAPLRALLTRARPTTRARKRNMGEEKQRSDLEGTKDTKPEEIVALQDSGGRYATCGVLQSVLHSKAQCIFGCGFNLGSSEFQGESIGE